MPSSYTTSLRLTLPATGELAGQWGNTVNTGITELLDAAVAGTTTISTWGGAGVSYTLSNNSGSADEARRMFIVATGTPGEAKNVICPAVSKFYVFRNDTTGGFALTLKTPSGTGVSVPAGQYRFLYCDGTNVVEMFNSVGSLTVIGALNAGSVNATTLDLTNLEVTNIKAKDGTASMTLADATGVATFSANPILNAGTANGVLYLNGSKVATSGSALTFDGTNLNIGSTPIYGFLNIGNGGTTNYATVLTLNGTNNAANGTAIVGRRNGTNAWLIGDTAASLGSGTGFTSYNYGSNPWIWYLQDTGETMRLTSTGLGIGTSSPGGLLGVNGATVIGNQATTGTDGSIRLITAGGVNYIQSGQNRTTASAAPLAFTDMNGSSEWMRLSSTGNLGIGTSSPITRLDINKASQTPGTTTPSGGLIVKNTAAGAACIEMGSGSSVLGYIQVRNTDDSTTYNMALQPSGGNVGIGTTSPGNTLDVNGVIRARGDIFAMASGDRIQLLPQSAGNGGIIATANSAFSAYSPMTLDASLYVWRPNGSEQMRLTSAGNLGIGTSGPTVKLDVHGSLGSILGQFFENTSGQNRRIRFSISSNVGTIESTATTGATNLAFAVDGLEHMRITSAGDVGIGTSSPATTLHVQSATGQVRIQNTTSGTALIGFRNSVTTDIPWVGTGGDDLRFITLSTERMRLDSSGNLGIGTSSPTSRLTVSGGVTISSDTVITGGSLQYRNGISLFAWNSDTTNYYTINNTGPTGSGNAQLSFGNVGGERMLLDSSGNLGLGTAPNSVYRLKVGGGAEFLDTGPGVSWGPWTSIQENGWFDAGGNFLHNAIKTGGVNDTWTYRNNGFATRYKQLNSVHSWYTAPSGTAGNAISFTQAMTLDASGNLQVGTTASAGRLTVNNTATGYAVNTRFYNDSTNTAGYCAVLFSQAASGAATGIIGTGGSTAGNVAFQNTFVVGTQTSHALVLATNDTERARITSGGDLLVGLTSTTFSNTRAEILAPTGNNGLGAKVTQSAYSPLMAWNADTTGDNVFAYFYTEGTLTARGSITYNRAGGLTAYNTTSDYRAKDIIGPVQDPGATIDALKVYEGVMKGATQSRPMLIAHEAQEHAPYAVSGVKDEVNEDGTPKFQQIDVSSLVPLLLAEIQSLRARVAALESQP